MYLKQYHIHFVGIGGIGMSGIAELLLNLGYAVSGSDLIDSDITQRLRRLGGTIHQGHAPSHIEGADVVVISSAVARDNPEVKAAEQASLPVIPRAEMLAELMRLKFSVAVAGAHGKTSTTSIVSAVLAEGGLDPTIVIGGKLRSTDTNALLGQGDFIVAEADESDGSFLKMAPSIAVVTNIDREHLDFYRDLEEIKDVFLQFIDRIPFYGLAVLCLDNEPIQDVIPRIRKRYTTYGMTSQADFQASEVTFAKLQTTFTVSHLGQRLGRVTLNLPGQHNIYNALASIAVGMELNTPFDTIKKALETLQGVQRRMEIKGEPRGITVVDDYGHHPTEIKTTLQALAAAWPENRKVVAFQPHRYTRTQALFDEFTRAFYQTDKLLVLPIYAAGEAPIQGVEGQRLYEGILAHGHKDVVYVASLDAARQMLIDILKPGDIFLTLGAGDVWRLGEALVADLSPA
jgi:UDP-N-acetylmuramate--alanine ligase